MTRKRIDKIALATGGTSGIGLATAQRFVAEGAHVFITGRRESEPAAAVKAIGHNVTGVRGDVSNLADLSSTASSCSSMAGWRRFDARRITLGWAPNQLGDNLRRRSTGFYL